MRAEALLKRMEEQAEMGNEDVKPDTTTYNTTITAWANGRDANAGAQAEALLNLMEEEHKMGHEDDKPNSVTFNSIIAAWANSQDPNAGIRAEAILQQMQQQFDAGNKNVKPNTVACSSVISAWAKSYHPDSGSRGERILPKALGCGRCQCTAEHHYPIMQQSVLGAMDAIHNVLLELKPFCERCNSCIALVRPDVVTYNLLIHVLIKSDDPSAAGEQADKE